jgi:hypothetical protein
MIENLRQRLLEALATISALAPEMRFGQLMATLGFLAEDKSDHTIWEIEDAELLQVFEGHRAELADRQSKETQSAPAKRH